MCPFRIPLQNMHHKYKIKSRRYKESWRLNNWVWNPVWPPGIGRHKAVVRGGLRGQTIQLAVLADCWPVGLPPASPQQACFDQGRCWGRWRPPRTGWCSSRSSTGTRASPTSPTSSSSQVSLVDKHWFQDQECRPVHRSIKSTGSVSGVIFVSFFLMLLNEYDW